MTAERTPPTVVGFVMFPGIAQLDLTGPAQVLAKSPGFEVHDVASTLEPVPTDSGFSILPTKSFDDCPRLSVICVPGGFGQIDLMDDEPMLEFVRRHAATAEWITSVCSGSLVLGAAGPIDGYRATSHSVCVDQLALLGPMPTFERSWSTATGSPGPARLESTSRWFPSPRSVLVTSPNRFS